MRNRVFKQLSLRAFIGRNASSQRLRRNLAVLTIDVLVASICFPVAMLLRYGDFGSVDQTTLAIGFLLTMLFAVLVFYASRLYRRVWRLASVHEFRAIVTASTIVVAAVFAGMFLANRLDSVPRTVPFIQLALTTLLLCSARLVVRLRYEFLYGVNRAARPSSGFRALVVGVGEEANWFLRSNRSTSEADVEILGLIGINEKDRNLRLADQKVIGLLSELDSVLNRFSSYGRKPHRIIIAQRVSVAEMQAVVELAKRQQIDVFTLPSPTEMRTAKPGTGFTPRPVSLADFLNRETVNLDQKIIRDFIRGRRVLLTGAGGSIGSELTRQIAACQPSELCLLDASEFNLYSIELNVRERFPHLSTAAKLVDVRERDRLFQLFKVTRPEIVFHAAALKHVPLVEENPVAGVLTNVFGTRNVADASRAVGASAFVQISTDKAVNTTNIMGATKRFAEFYVQNLDLAGEANGTRFMTVRFGNVLGSSGSVVPRFLAQLAEGGPLTVTHPEIKRYFMTIPEAVELVLQAAAHGVASVEHRGRIFVLEMGEPIKIADLARQLIKLSGFQPDQDIKIVYTGLRPGEKLHEELFDAAERIVPGPAEGLLSALSAPIPHATLSSSLRTLEQACVSNDEPTIRKIIADAIPGFAEPIKLQTTSMVAA